MARLLYPIGIQNFREIREGGYVYVDKTEYIHRLATSGKYYFLSRPRRFGKSLLLSTIECLFKGDRQLFDGLAISALWQDWTPAPVMHLDLTGSNYNTPGSLRTHLDDFLSGWEAEYGIVPKHREALGLRFGRVISEVHRQTGQRVVILVDEYDKPLLETADRPELQEEYRGDLRSFYSNLKSQDGHIRFAMLTGVTKFGHLSIFSDLNNLHDISMDRHCAGICGVTGEELNVYFHEGVEGFARANRLGVSEAYAVLKENYDGYHFSTVDFTDVYNPFSLLNCLSNQMAGAYWFRTGTPAFLIRMMRSGHLELQTLGTYRIDAESLSDVQLDLKNYIPVLYQSGYLTIKEYSPEFDIVTLGFPNKEVTTGFFKHLLAMYTPLTEQKTSFEISRFVMDVQEGRAEDFMTRLQSLFADFQYDAFELRRLEQHYQDVIYIVMKLLGFHVHTEYRTATGRIDLLITTSDYIYIFEFKIDKSAQEALEQIKAKKYLLPFRADGRKIVEIGANFSSAARGLDSWIINEE